MSQAHDSRPAPRSPSPIAISRGVWLAALALAWLPGCHEELGPETLPVTSVRGRVTEGGKPVSRGWIEFYPVDGAVGNLRSARIGPDGSFAADGVAVGRNLVRLVNMPVSSQAVRQILGAFHSPIRRNIPSGGDQAIQVDVLDEFMSYQRSLMPSTQGGAAGIRR